MPTTDRQPPTEPAADPCPVCRITRGHLDTILQAGVDLGRQIDAQLGVPAEPNDPAEHVLATICSWWVEESLTLTGGDPGPLMACLGKSLAEHGIVLNTRHQGPLPTVKES